MASDKGASSWNDLEDKPFYEDADSLLVASGENSITSTTPLSSFMVAMDFLSIEGKTYRIKVVYGPNVYEDVHTAIYDASMGMPIYHIGSPNSDYVIRAQNFGGGSSWMIYLNPAVDAVSESITVEIYEESFTLVSLDDKFIPDSIARSADVYNKSEVDERIAGAGGATSWNDLKDKPFYEESNMELIAGPAQCTTMFAGTFYSPSILTSSDLSSINDGDTVIFEVDGTQYECSAQVTTGTNTMIGGTMTDYVFTAIGDHGVSGSATRGGYTSNQLKVPGANGTYTLSLYHGSKTIVPLDEKFIPDSVSRNSDLDGLRKELVTSYNDLEDIPCSRVDRWVGKINYYGAITITSLDQSHVVKVTRDKVDYTPIIDCTYKIRLYRLDSATMSMVDYTFFEGVAVESSDGSSIHISSGSSSANYESSTGLWSFSFQYPDTIHSTQTIYINVSARELVYNPIDEKYIPDTIARTTDIPTSLSQLTNDAGYITAEDIPEGSGGAAIIDVVELPTENIKEDSWYRKLTGTFVYNQYVQNGWTCYCVETLPEVGEPVTVDMQSVLAYYNIQDGNVYGYVNDALGQSAGIPAGWYTIDMLAPTFQVDWGGIIYEINDDTRYGSIRLFLKYTLHSYKEGVWSPLHIIGKSGAGHGAETFNYPDNRAPGDYSHAEGYSSTAEGDYSHVEGRDSYAVGVAAHAEGVTSEAHGMASHAEGSSTYAEGHSSHAEGSGSRTEGEASHAEGYNTYAEGHRSHVEGSYSYTKGTDSHAEGYNGNAIGSRSHTEGLSTTAIGECSHTEGCGHSTVKYITGDANAITYAIDDTTDLIPGTLIKFYDNNAYYVRCRSAKIVSIDKVNSTITVDKTLGEDSLTARSVEAYFSGLALGPHSHSEGRGTVAAGTSQHVQGEYNIIDPEYDINDSTARGKYAHIVGNGRISAPSNAHTLDWSGNAWFQGDVYVGGTGQDDETAEKLIKQSDLANAEVAWADESNICNWASQADCDGDWNIITETYATKAELGEISAALDELHAYAQALTGGAES